MFEDSLLEKRFGGTYRGRAALISFALQIAFIGILVVMPLIFIEALPARELVTFLVAPPPPPPPPPPAAVDTRPIKTVKHKIVSDMLDTGQLRTPTRIPKKVAMIKESAPPLPPSSAEGVVAFPAEFPAASWEVFSGELCVPRRRYTCRLRPDSLTPNGFGFHKA